MFIVQILAIASLTMTTQTGVLNIMGFSMVLGILLVICLSPPKPNLTL